MTTEGDGDGRGAHRLDRLRRWPGTRAVLGGLLVGVAVLGVLLVGDADASAPTTAVLVAARDLPAGTVLEPADLARAELHLPDEVMATVFVDADDLVGRRTLTPVGRAEVLGRSVVFEPVGDVLPPFELSFALDGDRAVDGRLRSGELVDVIVTTGGPAPASEVVAHDVVVADVRRPDSGSPSSPTVVTLAFADRSIAVAVAAGADAGDVRLLRVRAGSDG
jgi:Flp pilus assembly protein CpaB